MENNLNIYKLEQQYDDGDATYVAYTAHVIAKTVASAKRLVGKTDTNECSKNYWGKAVATVIGVASDSIAKAQVIAIA